MIFVDWIHEKNTCDPAESSSIKNLGVAGAADFGQRPSLPPDKKGGVD